MKHEDDKWLEQQLKAQPRINNDDFSNIVMNKIEVLRNKNQTARKNILLATYIISFASLLIATPWSWLSTTINNYQSLQTILNQGSQPSIIGLSILFVISFSIFIFGQETN